MRTKKYKSLKQKGFTLIELITVIGILGVLIGLSLTAFGLYRQNAAVAVLNRLAGDTVSDVEGAFAQPDITLPSVSSYEQTTMGPIADSTARQILQAVVVPRLVTYRITVDPSCTSSGCTATTLELYHERADSHVTSLRTGDGLWVTAEMP